MDSHPQFRKGLWLNFISAFCFYAATLFIPYSPFKTHPEVFAFARYFLGLLFSLSVLKKAGLSLWPREGWRLLVGRSLFNLLAVICFYRTVAESNPSFGNVMNMTYPLYVSLLAGFVLKEKVSKTIWPSILISLLGLLIYLWGALLKQEESALAGVWGLASGLTAGLAILFLRAAAHRYSAQMILFWMYLLGLPILGFLSWPYLFAPAYWSVSSALNLSASAVLGISGQYFLTRSFKYLDATSGSMVSVVRIPMAVLFGFAFFGEAFSGLAWLGALLIFWGDLMLARKAK